MRRISFILIVVFLAGSISAKDGGSRSDLTASLDALSETMQVDGAGPDQYESFLHPAFSRWDLGGEVVDRKTLVASLREWWEEGFRVSDGRSRIVHVAIQDDVAVVRFERFERFVDRDGQETGTFSGFVTQVWIGDSGGWKLFSIDISPLPVGDD